MGSEALKPRVHSDKIRRGVIGDDQFQSSPRVSRTRMDTSIQTSGYQSRGGVGKLKGREKGPAALLRCVRKQKRRDQVKGKAWECHGPIRKVPDILH